MLLYVDPITTTCRLLLALVKDQNLPVEMRPVSIMAGENRSPEHAAINPTGKLPFLVDDDFVLTESLAIARYLLAGRDCDLYPSSARARARVDELLDWVTSTFNPAFLTGLVYPRLFAQMGNGDPVLEDALRARALTDTDAALGKINHRLADSGAFLLGETVTLADFAFAASVIWAPVISYSLAPYPAVAAWRERIRDLEAWRPCEAALEAMIAR